MPRIWIGSFKGPKGDTGEQGLQGPQGPQGISGEKGDPGAVDENTPITFEVPKTYQTPESGNAIKVLFGKIAKGLSDLFAAVGVLASLKTVEKSTLVTAINELAEGKLDVAKLVASTNITEPGFAMDGKTASEAFAELYSKFGYTDILNDVISDDKSKITVSYAYVLNGIAVISLLLKSGIQPGPHPFHISNPKYFPKATVYGIYASTQSAMDNGKLNSATISSLGSGSIYIGEAITYDNEGVMYIYPITM